MKEKEKKAARSPVEHAGTTTAVQPASFEAWVKEFTGGPNGCQVVIGGTCVRPDIFFANDKTCDNCECHPYCLCRSKRFTKRKPASA